jgi:hypothetical protein
MQKGMQEVRPLLEINSCPEIVRAVVRDLVYEMAFGPKKQSTFRRRAMQFASSGAMISSYVSLCRYDARYRN